MRLRRRRWPVWVIACALAVACGSSYGTAPDPGDGGAGVDGSTPPNTADANPINPSDDGGGDGGGTTIVPGCTVSPGSITNGLVAYYPLDEGQGTAIKDCSGRGHDGQILRLATDTWSTGKRGGAIRVRAPDGCIDFGVGPDFRFAGAFTAMAWVNVASFPPSGNEAILGKSIDLDVDGWRLDSTIVTELGAAVATTDAGILFIGKENQPTATWVHLTVTFVPNVKLEMFINGTFSSRNTWNGPLRDSERTPFRIGCRGDNGGFFNGSVDEVRLYDRELTSTEIALLSAPP